MRVFRPALRRARRARRRAVARIRRLPHATRVTLVCLPALAAVLVLALFVSDAGRPAAVHRPRPAPATRPAQPPAARPPIVPRSAWLGPARLHPQPPPRYADEVIAVVVHHTDSPNGYACADAPRVIRRIYDEQTGVRGWDDIGYNFLVDRCGTIYEGRAGGVDRPVVGAHTQGFNHRTAGVAAIGTFTAGMTVPKAMTDAIAAVAAWKLGLAGVDPRTIVHLISSSGLSRYPAGASAALPAIAGHDDGYRTSCPGAALSARLPEIRELAARLQGRSSHPQRRHSRRAGHADPARLRS
ncbi:peptidoglycan recognition protein [Streptomyces sp. NPDC020490]|uniref:peptidoglycan recognition protein n=1 Tax=Streptomyces sp. NPDC020490 TaxID=3365078 RepID=UPI00379E89D2